PHVFSDVVADTPDAVMANWEQLKAEEKPHRQSVLDGIPSAMPSLLLADKLVGKARGVGAPLPEAPDAAPATEEELGELLLALVADAKARGLDAERALRERLRVLADGIRESESAGVES